MFKKTIFSSIVLVMITIILSGCNTMQGAGKDMSKAGEALAKSAEENRNY